MTNAVVQVLRNGSFAELARCDRTDGQLLDLFVRHRDQAAFAAIVQRHGPMVLGVCKRVLRNATDADDAFQAAFLVLARKAASIGTRDLLAQWLYGVAHNTARRLLRANTRRALREMPLAELPEPSLLDEATLHRELLAILDDELSRLPDRYRLPIVLCDLEGTTRKEAARMLGCPEGTVAGRLARARALLAARLTSRGVAPTAAILAAILAEQQTVAISQALVTGIARAASLPESANAAAMGLVSPRVANTTEGVLKAMFMKNLKTAAFALLLGGIVIAGMAGFFRAFAEAEPNMPLADPNDDKSDPRKPASPAASGKKVVTVVPLKKLNGTETAEKLTKLFPPTVTVAPARDENVLLVYATEAATEDVLKVLEILGEKREKPATVETTMSGATTVPGTFAFNMLNVPWEEVIAWYSKTTGLAAINPIKPEGKLTFSSPGDKRFMLSELTDIINEMLSAQKLILVRGNNSFTILRTDENIPRTAIPHIELSELAQRGKTELVEVDILLAESIGNQETLVPEIAKLLSPLGRVSAFPKRSMITVSDTAGSVARVLKVLQHFEKQSGGDQKAPTAATKKFRFRMQSVPWTKVLDWYAEISELSPAYRTVPSGHLTFIPPNEQQYTLSEITDIINQALLQQGYLLVKRTHSFTLIPADEKIDPSLATPTKLDELKDRGNTELVEVVIPAPKKSSAAQLANELRSMQSPFGTIAVQEKTNTLIVIDIGSSARRIVQAITEIEDAKPKKNLELEKKKFRIQFEKAPWNQVLEWYAKETGLTPKSIVKPSGEITFTSPPNTLLSIGEVTDKLNEMLSPQGLILIRGKESFTVVRRDEKIPDNVVPHVEFNELHNWGKSELVEVDIPLEKPFLLLIQADMPKLGRHLTSLGQIVVFAKEKGLTVRDVAGNQKRIRDALKEWEAQMIIKPIF